MTKYEKAAVDKKKRGGESHKKTGQERAFDATVSHKNHTLFFNGIQSYNSHEIMAAEQENRK